ncbi:MerR family transcriptional regulator [Leucobacter sp. W1153]|uniref:MerR family transcriptional regulator n=1 Tax=Leucobacter sp. W1153 TaxID=3439064 RepID=UPI003F2FC8E1
MRETTPTSQQTLHIGDLADATGLSLRTLRHYDEIGLLRASGRSEGGYRLYTAQDLERLLAIRRMKPLGFSLDEMADLLRMLDEIETDPQSAQARVALEGLLRDACERRERLQQHLEMADEFIGILERYRRNN